MNHRPVFIALAAILLSLAVSSQTRKEIEDLYKDANSYFYFEDYEEAVALYLQVLPHYPDNFNLLYRIGVCYLNIPGSKDKAIGFLEKASRNTTHRYNEQSILETKAPIDAIFYLGNAYFINNQIAKAEREYQRFSELIKSRGKWNIDYLTHQIETAKSSVVIQSLPVNFLRNNLGEPVNDRFSNYNPSLSGDGNTLAFTTKRKFYQAVYVTRKVNDAWSTPINITLDLQVDGNCSTLSLSQNGNELYLFKDDNHDGNIYVTRYENGKWLPMKKLNNYINTEYYETHASISSDGKILYFTSNRKGGYGDLDIYVSERGAGDNWGLPKNLGPEINTPLNENTPFITVDGNFLFFSSEGHNNMGGYDIFIAQRKSDGSWNKPINLGYPINTTDDDLFYHPIGDGSFGLIALFDREGYGEQDIYQVEMFVPKFQKTIVTTSSFADRINRNNLRTLVIDTLNSPGVALIDPTPSENVKYLDPKKQYKLFFEGKGYNLRDLATRTKMLITQAEGKKPDEKINIPVIAKVEEPVSIRVDSAEIRSIQKRINQLKQVSDTSRIATTAGKPAKRKDLAENTTITAGETALNQTNYLPEILLLLASGDTQSKLTRLLKHNWQIPSSLLKIKLSELASEADSAGTTEELAHTFTRFLDLLSTTDLSCLQKKTRTIATEEEQKSFIYLYNQITNKASPELATLLSKILIKYPKIQSFEKLLNQLKKEYPDEYQKYLPELLRIMAETGIETYIGLPEESKFEIYNTITTEHESRSYSWIIYSIIAFVLLGIMGIAYSRKRNS
jgi:tetratricopeptide (TPR) repeat protein